MRSWLVVVVLVIACGGKQDAGPAPISNTAATPTEPAPQRPTRDQQIMARMREFRTQMCNCTAGDADCAKRVSDDMVRWAEAEAKNPETDKGPIKSNAEAEQVGIELGECMAKAMMPPDPNAGSGSATPTP